MLDANRQAKNLPVAHIGFICKGGELLNSEFFIITMLPSSTENREANDKDEAPSTASAKPRASDASPPGPLQSPAAIADGEPSSAATADRNLAAENAEVEAILDAWARGPPTPPAYN